MAKRKSLGLIIELYGPLAASVVSAVAIYFCSDSIIGAFRQPGGWQVSSLYGAVFNWSAIQIGFAFGVYGFVVGKNAGFVQEIRERLAMNRFLGYVRRANIGGFALTVASLPLAITNPTFSDPHSPIFFAVMAWFCLFLWTFLAFLRVAYGFGHLSSIKDQPEFYGA